MTAQAEYTWPREVAVLVEIVREAEANRLPLPLDPIAERLGLSAAEIGRAAQNLQRGGYIRLISGYASPPDVEDVSAAALRATGAWPTPESALDRMVAALEAIADDAEADPETRSRARRILHALGGAGRQIGISVVSAIVTEQLT